VTEPHAERLWSVFYAAVPAWEAGLAGPGRRPGYQIAPLFRPWKGRSTDRM